MEQNLTVELINQEIIKYLNSIQKQQIINTYGTKEDLNKEALNTLFEIVFNPKTENNSFSKEFVESEKEKLKIIIEGKKDNKAAYAYLRCQEEMYKNIPFGLYKYGYIEDIDSINENNIYEYYQKLISEAKIDIFVSGDIEEEKIIETIKNNENIKKLNEREPIYEKKNKVPEIGEEKEITDTMEVTQGNLVLGLLIEEESKREKYIAVVYNAILGGTATSKMFQNVREKNSLAYTAASNYLRHKNSIFIRCGIEISNYDKALKLIKEQIEDMKNGNFDDEDIKNAKVRNNFNYKIYTR